MLLQFLCHRDAHLNFGETAQNDPMVKGFKLHFLGSSNVASKLNPS